MRHGTATLFAALEIATGQVAAALKPRHRRQELLAFLRQVARAYPDQQLHLVMDGYAAHKTPEVTDWLEVDPRIHVRSTPTHASWTNLVEVWFGIVERQALNRGTFKSVKDLNTKIRAFIDGWNQRSHPFVWTKTADEVLAKANRKKTSEPSHWRVQRRDLGDRPGGRPPTPRPARRCHRSPGRRTASPQAGPSRRRYTGWGIRTAPGSEGRDRMCAADRGLPAAELEALRRELVLYGCALRLAKTWLDNLDEYYSALAGTSPVEHIKCRLKSVDSIAEKLSARGLPLTAASAVENLTDIAGARVICSYTRDIAEIVAVLRAHRDIEVIAEKDYVTQPKPSGYRSYHLLVSVTPGGLFGGRSCPVEIQVRTAAMDFWASLEHKVRYKYAGDVPEHLRRELYLCAEKTNAVDERLYLVHELVGLINE